MNNQTITRYEQGGAQLRQAVAGLSAAEMQAFPIPNTWSIQQIVMHLMDSDLIAADRMKRVIAEEMPPLIGYNESKFAAALFYHQQSVDDAITLFEVNRRQFARVLRQLPPAAFERLGMHNERGVMTLGKMLEGICGHLEHHLAFIQKKRGLLNK